MPNAGDLIEAFEHEAGRTRSLWRRLTAAQLLAGSFLALIALGTFVLLVVPGLYTGERLSFVNALFTATSVVCVTGLMLVDPASYFTPFGQVVILVLIQLGGLGILTVTTMIILRVSGRLTLRSEALFHAGETGLPVNVGRLLRTILSYTLWIEGVGAFALWLGWSGDLGRIDAVWPAIFHSVSAFCNAGISIFAGSLAGFRDRPLVLSTVMVLAVTGGLGFLVLQELMGIRRGTAGRRLSLHTRLVLVTSAVFIALGAVLFALFEWSNVLEESPTIARPFLALFLSVATRSVGFYIVEYEEMTTAALFLTMLLMMVGGSPGSTAGGLKTTTIAVLVALAIARLRGRVITQAFRRTIPEATIQRAIGLVVIVVTLLATVALILMVTELGATPHPATGGRFLELAFETVSAFNTVGVSTGITTELSNTGKLLMAGLMYLGRVGPLTFAASMVVAAQRTHVRMRYATEDVIIG